MLFLFLIFQIWIFGIVSLWFQAKTVRGRNAVVLVAIFLAVMGVAAAQYDRSAIESALRYFP